MKKFLTILSLCLVLFASSLTLFACDKNNKPNNVYEQMSELLKEFKQDEADIKMFSTQNVEGVSSKYAVKYYVDNTNYAFYNQCLVIPMNFIDTYTKDLERINLLDKISKANKTKISSLESSISQIKNQFDDSAKKYKYLQEIIGSSETVTEGNVVTFNKSMVSFMKYAYQIAIKMAELKNDLFDDYHNLESATEVVSPAQAIELRDYFLLYNAYDYYKILFENMKGEYFDLDVGNQDVVDFGNTVKNIKKAFKDSFALQSQTNLADITGAATPVEGASGQTFTYEKKLVKEMFENFNILQNERTLLNTSLNYFNFHDFYVTHSCNFVSMSASEKNAENYYNEICTYYLKYNTSYIAYLKNIFTKKD